MTAERPGKAARIALYSHDTMGLGHLRRNIRIARSLAESDLGATVLLITGAREASAFEMPPGCECLALPGFFKEASGRYRSRALQLSLDELVSLRASAIVSAIDSFSPDVFVVDKAPRGVLRELDPTLEMLREDRSTRVVLGLRDVLDDPETVDVEWARDDNVAAIEDFYHEVWIYGDPSLYDASREYEVMRGLRDRISFTGYLAVPPTPCEAASLQARNGQRKLALCLVGGGQDGVRLADSFASAEIPEDSTGLIVTGPFMQEEDRAELHRRAASRSRLHVLDFAKNVDGLIAFADQIVTMGGYNSICEALGANKPMLIVPRSVPRREQSIRAELLRSRKIADVLHAEDLDPTRISSWLRAEHELAPPGALDLDGLSRIPAFVARALDRKALEAAPLRSMAQ
jgi:predicted glycosyltransferase